MMFVPRDGWSFLRELGAVAETVSSTGAGSLVRDGEEDEECDWHSQSVSGRAHPDESVPAFAADTKSHVISPDVWSPASGVTTARTDSSGEESCSASGADDAGASGTADTRQPPARSFSEL